MFVCLVFRVLFLAVLFFFILSNQRLNLKRRPQLWLWLGCITAHVCMCVAGVCVCASPRKLGLFKHPPPSTTSPRSSAQPVSLTSCCRPLSTLSASALFLGRESNIQYLLRVLGVRNSRRLSVSVCLLSLPRPRALSLAVAALSTRTSCVRPSSLIAADDASRRFVARLRVSVR